MGVEEKRVGELRALKLTGPDGSTVTVATHGAHVVSWEKNVGGRPEELLFLSSKAVFKAPKSIRGGIPICFPQFGNLGPCAAQHGFARNSEWTLTSEVSPSATAITLTMESSEESLKVFPYEFAINFIVTLSDAGALITRMEVVNNGTSVMPFTCALHTYFATPDVSQVSIEGLMGTEYLDYMQDRKQMSQTENAVGFAKEVDCIYMDTPDTLKLHCSPTRTILLKKTGLPDAVVWNPWIAKAQAMGDFGDDEYKTMFCVEAALAKGSGAPVQLGGGMQWACEQELSVA